jgi:predicted amidohydrolase
MRNELRVTLVQNAATWHDAAASIADVRKMLEGEPPEAGSLLVLPETFATGFTGDVTQADDGTTVTFLKEVAAQHSCFVIGGIISRGRSGKAKNLAVGFGPDGEQLCEYAKIHLFALGEESFTFESGDKVATFDLGGCDICPLICFDLRFPETFRRAVGAEVFVVIANWPAPRQFHRDALLAARAIENQAYVVAVNRVGSDPNTSYVGGSCVLSPDGRDLLRMGDAAGTASTTIDLASQRILRQKLPFLPR